jgi:hypothetical protein
MKRDMNIIRLILLQQEGDEEAGKKLKEIPDKESCYHIGLAIEAGLVKGEVLEDGDREIVGAAVWRLTWDGHEFLDSVRDASVWKKANEKVIKPAGGIAFDVLKAWLKSEAMKHLGLDLSGG